MGNANTLIVGVNNIALQAAAWCENTCNGTVIGLAGDSHEWHRITRPRWPILGALAQVEAILRRHQVQQVIFALPPEDHEALFPLISQLAHLPVRLRVVAEQPPPPVLGTPWEAIGDHYLVDLWTPMIPLWQRRIKRLLDVCASALAMLVLSPLLAGIALAIKLEDRGPVLYRSLRVGENGQLFSMVKFRSMIVDAERLGNHEANSAGGDVNFYKREDDPRVTHVGRFLRRTSLDELPQLWNIFKGDMSLVGPRPELPWLLDRHQPWNWPRFALPQGLTGWWQVNGRSDSPGQYLHPEDDLYYARHCSLWLDLVVLWKTVGVVLKGKGAY